MPKVLLRPEKGEELDNVFARHERLARATRSAMEALGLKLLAPQNPASSATGVYLPEGLDGKKFVKYIRDELGVTMAGGQDHLEGKIIRIAHLGYIDTFDIITAVSAVEMALEKFGQKIALGKGVGAAQKILLEGYR